MSGRKFTLEAGAFIRGRVKRELKSSAHSLGLDLAIQEDKGFLESLFLCEVSGHPATVDAWMKSVRSWVEQNQ